MTSDFTPNNGCDRNDVRVVSHTTVRRVTPTRINDSDLKARLVNILPNILVVLPDAMTDDFSLEHCETWDSLRQITLVFVMGDDFQIVFDESDASFQFTSTDKCGRGAAFSPNILFADWHKFWPVDYA